MQISFLLWIENDVAKLISHDQPPARRTDAAPHLPYVPGRNDKLEVDLGTVLAAAGFEADTAATATVLLLLEGRPGGRLGWVEDYTAGQEHMRQDKGGEGRGGRGGQVLCGHSGRCWPYLGRYVPRMIGVQCHFTSPHSKTKSGRTTGNFQ